MDSQHIRLTDIPAHGREFSFLDGQLWRELIQAQGADYAFQPTGADTHSPRNFVCSCC